MILYRVCLEHSDVGRQGATITVVAKHVEEAIVEAKKWAPNKHSLRDCKHPIVDSVTKVGEVDVIANSLFAEK